MKSLANRKIVTTTAIQTSTAKPVSPSTAARLHPFMRPVLAFVASQQLLSSHGIRFTRELDDLDTHRIARYLVDGVLVQFLAYDHSEKDHISVYVDVSGADKVKHSPAQIAISAMGAFQLSEAPVSWVNEKFQVPLTSLAAVAKPHFVVIGQAVVRAKKPVNQVAGKATSTVNSVRPGRQTREFSY